MKQDDSSKILGLQRNIFFAGVVSFFMDFWLFLTGATFLFGTAPSWLAAILFSGFLFFPQTEK
jgi:hypothetical protein